MELEDFVESQGVSMDDFEAQCQQYAQAKVKQNLIIQGIMDAEGMTLDDKECLAIQDQLVEQYASGDLAALIDTYGQVAVDETIGLMRVEDFIIANANYDQTAGEDAEAADTEEGQTTDEAGEEQTAAGETEEEKQDIANDGADSEKADSNADAQDTNTEDSSQEGAE